VETSRQEEDLDTDQAAAVAALLQTPVIREEELERIRFVSGKKILVAEDLVFNIESLEMAFERLGLRDDVVFCTDGQQAIMEIKESSKQRFGLYLLDYNMPLKNGMEVLKSAKLQHLLNGSEMPRVVFLSAYITEDLKQKAEKLGVKDFI